MKAEITLSVEFELNPDYYDDGAMPEEMLDVEITNAKNRPLEYLSHDDIVKVSGKLIS